jgi:hypothetical protein
MSVLNPKCFEINFLQDMKANTGARDLLMLERCVLALELVGRLRQYGLDFVFKGGTSLLLHLSEPKRLSIDVDILCLDQGKLPEVLDQVVSERPFHGWRHLKGLDRMNPPTVHYAVDFDSVVNPEQPFYVMIDVLAAENPYATLVNKELNADFVEPVESVTLPLPSTSSLLGDKLAAFAPGTIGFPYQRNSRKGEALPPMPGYVVKHLYDLGQIAVLAENLSETISTYERIHAEQCTWRGFHERNACLNDTQDAARFASLVSDYQKESPDSKIEFFRKGIQYVQSHMFQEPFGRAAVRIASARAALLAEIVRHTLTDLPWREHLHTVADREEIKRQKLTGEWADLDALKKTDAQAFMLWVQAQNFSDPQNTKRDLLPSKK